MKNLKNLIIAVLTLFVVSTNAQGLLIKGTFHNKSGKRILAGFTLTDDQGAVVIGHAHKLKYKLDLNREYVLHIYGEGYETKEIRFTTHTEDLLMYAFDFRVTLQEEAAAEITASVTPARAGNVFYDRKIRTFNYSRS